jgi:excisionase family DNA binding protein
MVNKRSRAMTVRTEQKVELRRRSFFVEEVSEMTGLSRCSVMKLIAQGRLQTVRVERRLLIPEEAIAAFLRGEKRDA